MNKILTPVLALVIVQLIGFEIYAQSSQSNKKRTNINFEDELVKGEIQKPELFYILQKKQFNFGKLIKLRDNFLPEMKKTAEKVSRGGK